MATLRLGDTITVVACDAIVDRIDTAVGNGVLEIYTGTLPTDPDVAPVGTLLAELTFSAAAFGSAAVQTSPDRAEATAAAITPDSSANATGTAGWFRVLDETGGNVMFIGDVTLTGGGGALELDNTSINEFQTVSCSSFKFSIHRNGTAT